MDARADKVLIRMKKKNHTKQERQNTKSLKQTQNNDLKTAPGNNGKERQKKDKMCSAKGYKDLYTVLIIPNVNQVWTVI